MGYTHYWRQKRAFTPEEWARIRTEFQRIYSAAIKTIRLDDVEATDDFIAFNGLAPDEDCETLVLERVPTPQQHFSDTERLKERRDGIFHFCKTRQYPYDAVVVSILAAARHIAPDAITVSSDGGAVAIKDYFTTAASVTEATPSPWTVNKRPNTISTESAAAGAWGTAARRRRTCISGT